MHDLQELLAQDAKTVRAEEEKAWEEKRQNLLAQEQRLHELATQLAQVPAKVKELEGREAACVVQEREVRAAQQAWREKEKQLTVRAAALQARATSLAEREQVVETQAADIARLHAQLEEKLQAHMRRHDALDSRAQELAAWDTQLAVDAERLHGEQERFHAQRLVRVREEEARLSESARLLTKREEALETKASQYDLSPLQVAARQAALDARLDVCVKLEANLAAQQTALAASAETVTAREAACKALEEKQVAWKTSLEVRELRVQKRERAIEQLIEKRQLQDELKSSDG